MHLHVCYEFFSSFLLFTFILDDAVYNWLWIVWYSNEFAQSDFKKKIVLCWGDIERKRNKWKLILRMNICTAIYSFTYGKFCSLAAIYEFKHLILKICVIYCIEVVWLIESLVYYVNRIWSWFRCTLKSVAFATFAKARIFLLKTLYYTSSLFIRLFPTKKWK